MSEKSIYMYIFYRYTFFLAVEVYFNVQYYIIIYIFIFNIFKFH